MQTQASSLLGSLLDLALPQRCVLCSTPGSWLCATCETALQPLPAERCRHCGSPGPATMASCRECRGRQLWFASASAAFAYQGAAKALVTACKFRAYRTLPEEMADRALPAFRATCDAVAGGVAPPESASMLVTWVPGHRDHVLARGFNQAELFARGLARRAGLPAAALLRRTRHGARQSGLRRDARAANVHRSFALTEDAERVGKALKRVIILDDVYTTGETLSRCAEVLINAGFESHVFTFARTVRAAPVQSSLDAAVRKERCR